MCVLLLLLLLLFLSETGGVKEPLLELSNFLPQYFSLKHRRGSETSSIITSVKAKTTVSESGLNNS